MILIYAIINFVLLLLSTIEFVSFLNTKNKKDFIFMVIFVSGLISFYFYLGLKYIL